jgi:hypothetical protein
MTAKRSSQALLVVLLAFAWLSHAEEAAPSLEGVWGGTRNFGPAVRGTLEVTRSPSGWRVQIGPYDVQPVVKGQNVSFELPHEQGRFAGRLEKNETAMRGWWIQPPVSPILLRARGKNQWVGEVVPLEQEWTVYLVLSRKPDGELGAFIRNPDRNQGVFWQIERVEQDGDRVRLFC